jgi:hypothetical protein
MVLSSYGLRPSGDNALADKLNEGNSVACRVTDAEGNVRDDAECLAKLDRKMREGNKLDGVEGGDAQRWVDLHKDIMRRTRVDQGISRFQAIMSLYRALPTFIKVVMFICIAVGMLIAIIPGLMIFVEMILNRIAMFKVIMLVLFVFAVMLGYYMLPI